jgi:hypothetical protein
MKAANDGGKILDFSAVTIYKRIRKDERLLSGSHEVRGSTPLSSTKKINQLSVSLVVAIPSQVTHR